VEDFARAIESVDARAPQAVNARTGAPYQPGIGPHTESAKVTLVVEELADKVPELYSRFSTSVPYPDIARQRCDLSLGEEGDWRWALEVKMVRLLGDNGKPNDNMLMHILSPYRAHRSAVTDCGKLIASGFCARKGILIFGYESEEWPIRPAIDAFEALGSRAVALGAHAGSGLVA
jgi:hypothetical protein